MKRLTLILVAIIAVTFSAMAQTKTLKIGAVNGIVIEQVDSYKDGQIIHTYVRVTAVDGTKGRSLYNLDMFNLFSGSFQEAYDLMINIDEFFMKYKSEGTVNDKIGDILVGVEKGVFGVSFKIVSEDGGRSVRLSDCKKAAKKLEKYCNKNGIELKTRDL